MKVFLFVFILALLGACADVHEGEESTPSSPSGFSNSADYDGDLISNGIEISSGSNPYLADIPSVSIDFSQDYKMELINSSNTETLFQVSNKKDEGDFDFSYRVGDRLFKDFSNREISKISQFENILYGSIPDTSFDYFDYPRLKTSLMLSDIHNFSGILNAPPIEGFNLNITLNTSIIISNDSPYKQIKDIVLSFHYLDLKKNRFIKINETTFKRTLTINNREYLKIAISKLPNRILYENYLLHGKFIVARIENYYIPDLNTDYKSLLKSVSAKTLPVAITTPLNTSLHYVSLKHNTLTSILRSIYNDDFEISENALTRISQFTNNSADSTELRELRGHGKTGRWYILAHGPSNDIFNYHFKSGDRLILNFAIDHTKATGIKKVTTISHPKIDSDAAIAPTVTLGDVKRNSEVNILIN
ncbi:MAG: hypothetical protein HOM21_10525, partial [Halobacteriovoraceae bacterium]|nr:hypothetical protein [Halobacteriovoraceae bacterium]